MTAVTEQIEAPPPPIINVDISPTGFFQRFNLSGSGISHVILGTALVELPGAPVLRAGEEPDVFEAYPRSSQPRLEKVFARLGVAGTYSDQALALFEKEQALSSA
jgi:hypothetical protein